MRCVILSVWKEKQKQNREIKKRGGGAGENVTIWQSIFYVFKYDFLNVKNQ